jgi:mRNA-degrading endonuclease YafQ of YafQ-DinJ toxin-antitoxin module
MNVVQTRHFAKAVKKLHHNQKHDVDTAIRHLMENPLSGEAKVGDLSGVRVYKFTMAKQVALLAYSVDKEVVTLTLLYIGSHENFYRDVKKIL